MAKNDKLTRIVTQDNFVTEKIDVIQNNLLGDYDDAGEYSIAPQIVQELLKLEKVKRTSFANSIFCVGSLLGYGELVFELILDSKTHNGKVANASLYLLEDVDKINGYLQNTLKTKLDDYTNNMAENFIEETYRHFNISISNDSDEDDDAEVLERKLKDDLDNEDSFIIAKKQYSLMLEKLMEEKFLDAYGKYFTSRVSILTKLNNEFSQAVLESFNKQYNLIQNVFLKEKNYKILNELLDKCFEEYSGINSQFVMQESEYSKQIQPHLDTFVSSVNKLNEKFENKALNMLDREDRKKVEEIHEEYEDVESKEDEQEIKPDVEQIVNAVPETHKTTETKVMEGGVDEQGKQINTPEQEPETHFIEELMRKGSQTKEPVHEPEQSHNFYDAFKESHSMTPNAKVVDTSRSEHIERPNMSEELATASLKDRISRLEKFKNNSSISNSYTTATQPTEQARESSVSNVFNTLSREKFKKYEQIDIRNKRNRAEVDEIEQESADNNVVEQMTQRQREELLRDQELYTDYYDFEK